MSTYGQTLRLNEHWANYLYKTNSHIYNWAEGAYRSRLGKSVMNTLAFAMQLETTPDQIHLVIASTVASAKAVIEDGDGVLGLSQYFASRYTKGKYKGLECGYIKTPTGKKIVLYLGGSMESSYKAFRGISAGCIILEEANLLHSNTINEAKGRNLMAKVRKFFISMNPSANEHPIYKWLNELETAGIVNYNKSTIYENPALSEERRNEIISEFDPDSIFYLQYILGERVDAEGSIFNIRPYNVFDTINKEKYYRFIVSCDPGENASGTAIHLAGLCYNEELNQNEIHILKEYWHRNKDKENQKNPKLPRTYAQDYIDFIEECIEEYGIGPENILIDEDITFYRELIDKIGNSNIQTVNVKYVVKKEIEERIRMGVNLLYKGKLRFHSSCRNTINQFKNDHYDPKQIEKGKFVRFDNPLISNIDCVDNVEYICTWWYNLVYLK